MSDADNLRAPSYFSDYFDSQLRRCTGGGGGGVIPTLYIDRDPDTFAEIARHLQGYYIQPQDGLQYVRIFADAQFYSCKDDKTALSGTFSLVNAKLMSPTVPRLTAQLFETNVLIEIGDHNFRIPRSLLTHPNNSPNYFTHSITLSFASTTRVFPGLERDGLLRPPSIRPLRIDNRDPVIFTDLLRMLNGYEVHIRDEEHRSALLRDCRYYQFKGVEQRLLPHDISYNVVRRKVEIAIKLEHVKQAGLKFVKSDDDAPAWSEWLHYSRPNTYDQAYDLIIQIDGGELVLDTNNMRLIPHGQLRGKMKRFVDAVKKRYVDTTGVEDDIKGGGLSAKSSPAPAPAPMPIPAPLQGNQQPAAIPSHITHDSGLPVQFSAQFARETAITLDGIHAGQERWSADFGVSPSAASALALAPTSTSTLQSAAMTTASAPALGSALSSGQQGLSCVPMMASASTSALNQPSKRPRPADFEADTNSNSSSSSSMLKKVATRSSPSQQQQQQQQQQAPGPLQSGLLSPTLTGTAAAPTAAAVQPVAERTNRIMAKPRGPWIVNNSQWRVRVRLVVDKGADSSDCESSNGINNNSQQQRSLVAGSGKKGEVVFMAVKIEAYSGERERNKQRQFL
ncbi:hypothetical protein KEM54_003602 [Ascosphaera aggregata]|nr:hypothetical protein KEM54_003602 [Ascosphaera aggregata]